ncbi:hypothetical protein FPZ43_11490 [Mucilaginibacter pallidiroseus]|uniref:Uncharacterized protein n=1 Tax=Mucilaginibacter pallidiroseus TaxID=2599295 RepID=A0A563UC34_9SPHI|nr:hypothetical protein [Mucilaginibacter pallidiroseus]TWR28886.1 hypothetical protein FPZ43_11490 [Mucilaginibacter pallidiroseus]
MIIQFNAADTIHIFQQREMANIAAPQFLAALVPVPAFAVLVLAVTCLAATTLSAPLDHHITGKFDVFDP